ncbi:MAG: hypothetical protein QW156_04860 [Candidatus Aenigmatarchaeota archaeon]
MVNDTLVLDIVANDMASSKISNIENNIKKFGSVISSITTNIASLMSLNDAFDKIEKKTIALKENELALAKQQETINKLIAEGKEGTSEYSFALEKLNILQSEHALKLSELKDAQTSANLQLITFASSISTTLLTSLTSVTSAVKAFHVASLTAFVTSPIGLAIVGISTAIGILAFNVGGLRDKLFQALEGFISWLKTIPILNGIIEALTNLLRNIGLIKEESSEASSTFSSSFINVSNSLGQVEGSLERVKVKMEEISEIDPFKRLQEERIQEKIDKQFRDMKRKQELEFKIDILLDQAFKVKDNISIKAEIARELKKFKELGGELNVEQKIGLMKLGIDEDIFSDSARIERMRRILDISNKKPKEDEEKMKFTINEKISTPKLTKAMATLNEIHIENSISNLTSASYGFKDMAQYTKSILDNTKDITKTLNDQYKEMVNLVNIVKLGLSTLKQEIERLKISITSIERSRSSEVAIKNTSTNKASITTLKKY